MIFFVYFLMHFILQFSKKTIRTESSFFAVLSISERKILSLIVNQAYS